MTNSTIKDDDDELVDNATDLLWQNFSKSTVWDKVTLFLEIPKFP